jgi:glycosyltransferase involved in cell wall biosynthesis
MKVIRSPYHIIIGEEQLKKISIIIPCYNAEPYIDRCLETITNQTIGIDNIEIILVDDASTDNTFERLCGWEKQYPESILVVHCEKNGRQGTARNIGIGYATSEYIGFADIDDMAEEAMFEKMYEKARQYDCDMVVCRSKKHGAKQLESISMGRAPGEDRLIIINDESSRKKLLKENINLAVWNKIYRRDIITDNNIAFPEGFIYEDIYFSELIKHYVNRIYILEEYLYHHISRADSESNNTDRWQKKLDWFFVEQLKIEELKRRGIFERFKEHYEEDYIINYISLINNLIRIYGYIRPDTLHDLNTQVIGVLPGYKEIKLVRNMLNGKGGEYLQLLFGGFGTDLTEDYAKELARLYNEAYNINLRKKDH